MMEQYEEYSLQTIPEDRECSLSRLYDYLVVTDEVDIDIAIEASKNDKKYIFEGIVYD